MADLFSRIDEMSRVYESVYTRPPYNETTEDVSRFVKSWPERTRKPGFKLAVIENEKEKIIGFAYGWTSVEGGKFNQRVRDLLGDKAGEWLSDTFEAVDIAIMPEYQGMGLGRKLWNNLAAQIFHKRILLQTHVDKTKASMIYEKEGYVELVRFELSPGKNYRIMGKVL